jgi:hypothetical protein
VSENKEDRARVKVTSDSTKCSLSHGLEKARVGSWQMPNAMPMPMDGV